MRVTDIILKKRDQRELEPAEIHYLIDGYTKGGIPDYQMSAFLMAAFLNGLNDAETAALTSAMLYSGEVLDLSDLPGIKVDKHSTGGVGDKMSLLLAPIVAAAGVPVPMISGRSLGHSGGTLDKLESIPGLRADLDIPAYRKQLAALGVVMIGQTPQIAPADRKLYALRDVTGTVECIPLIASSIMSKKLAEGIDALVLDVKWGKGAFMKTREQARKLAETLVQIGEQFNKKTIAWLTDMNTPLGRAVGNWPEVVETVACLKGELVPDVMEVTLALCGEMIYLGGKASDPETGRAIAQEQVDNGKAFEKFKAMVEAQGGDPASLEHPEERAGFEPVATIVAPDNAAGFVHSIDAYATGMAALHLGAGRMTKEDEVDPLAGLFLDKKPGDAVQAGDVLARLYTQRNDCVPQASNYIINAFTYGESPPKKSSLLIDRYAAEGWFFS